jgi:hypothetical protein
MTRTGRAGGETTSTPGCNRLRKGFDILVELAAYSIEELTETILTFLGPTEGVVSTDTAYSYVAE